MSERINPNQICPHLGLIDDPDSRFAYPETAHCCFAIKPEAAIPLEHQTNFCFDQNYHTCSLFAPTADGQTQQLLPPWSPSLEPDFETFSPWRLMLWGMAVVITVALGFYSAIIFLQQPPETIRPIGTSPSSTPSVESVVNRPEVPTVTASSEAQFSPSILDDTSQVITTPIPAPSSIQLTTPTPGPDDRIYTLSPAAADIGWVVSSEDRGNNFGDSFLYAGIFNGDIYQSAFQFDLNSIPRGAPIYQAFLQLTGLQADRLGEGGNWSLHLLEAEIDTDWRRHNYQTIFNAETLQTLTPILNEADLAPDEPNLFELSTAQIDILRNRIIDDEAPTVSFRLEGPLSGEDNLFAWDTGHGPKSEGNEVTLILNVGPPPTNVPSYDYIVVTSTPTPENIATAAVIVLQITAEATEFGTATPPPPNMVTATPFPASLIITPTPTPENEATAQTISVLATAFALLTGTPTPFPTNAVTATPTATETPPPTFVIITSTPTPETLFGVATAIAGVQTQGIPTPLPSNWVTPIVVTATPTPANDATIQAQSILATAQALTTGTSTPTPSNLQTATPTPVFDLIEPILPPTPTPLSLPTPEAIPAQLLGKIIFLSDREGAAEDGQPNAYVFDPKSGQLGRLTARWPYEITKARDSWSADQRFRIFTKDAIRYRNVTNGDKTEAVREDVPAIFWYDYLYEVEEQLTNFGAGIAYGGAWSPTQEQITFVSNDSSDDEIWIVNRDGNGLRQLTQSNTEFNAREIGKDTFIPEINKHPSFSPDGQQIVFYSNRTGNNQLWIMNTDGSRQRLLMGLTPYSDWDPVWVKYSDLPPPLPGD